MSKKQNNNTGILRGNIFFQSHFVNDTSGHWERRDTCRTNHRIDFLLAEEVEKFCNQHSADRIKYKCHKA